MLSRVNCFRKHSSSLFDLLFIIAIALSLSSTSNKSSLASESKSVISFGDVKCCSLYYKSCHLAASMLDHFRQDGISWESISNYKKDKYLVINPKGKYIRIVNKAGKSTHGGWFNNNDEKLFYNLFFHNNNHDFNLPYIILPFNSDDFPVNKKHPFFAILSFCRYDNKPIDILWPGFQHPFPFIRETFNETRWRAKKNMAWFRGALNYGFLKGRYTIVNESQSIPHLVDARVTSWNHLLNDSINKYNLSSKRFPMEEAVQSFRYMLVIDGNCDSLRLQELLGRNVAIIKPISIGDTQWFSSMLKPWVHFIPVSLNPVLPNLSLARSDIKHFRKIKQQSNIQQVMVWASAHEEEVLRIIRNAHEFAEEYISLPAIRCYIEKLLHDISRLYTFDAKAKVAEISLSSQKSLRDIQLKRTK